MKKNRTLKISLVVALAIVVGAVAMSNSSVLKASEDTDAAYENPAVEEVVDNKEIIILEEEPAAEEPAAEVPAEEPAAEVPAEEPAAPAEAAPAADPEPTGDCSVRIKASFPDGEFEGLGTKIQLIAIIEGFENPTYQWQYSLDGQEWNDYKADGVNSASDSITYEINATNYVYYWRVIVEG